jgi:NADPH:quinone reductase-like Zn-dependent oxidoreductase
MSSWAALTLRAGLRAGEHVLINGATGASGRLAIRIARHLGAARIVATGRDESAASSLRDLGADAYVRLDQPHEDLVEVFRREIYDAGVDIVLDYLWGPPASSIIAAASAGAAAGPRRVRFVQIGTMAGDPIALSAGALRGSALELLGSGLGSVALEALIRAIADMFQAAPAAGFAVDAVPVPLPDVEAAWTREDARRTVFVAP